MQSSTKKSLLCSQVVDSRHPHIVSHLSNGLNGGSIFDQQFHDLNPVLLASDMKRSETILVKRGTENKQVNIISTYIWSRKCSFNLYCIICEIFSL